jgi:aminoglycoside 3-N-acetyltransferase
MSRAVTQRDIQEAIRGLGVSRQAVCLHSSLRSFGPVEGGPAAVVGAFLCEGCTVLVPTFSSVFQLPPPPHLRFERNGWNYGVTASPVQNPERVYSPQDLDIDPDMGAIPAEVVARTGRVRGGHPLDSFTAVGPRASDLVARQTPMDVYAPLAALARTGGAVLLIGVGLERMTLLHLAEKEAGRALFRRWANDTRGLPAAVEVGGCSEGFGRLEPYLRPAMRRADVGQSIWTLLPAAEALTRAAEAIRADPQVTHCGVETCERCDDAVKGGPILSAGRV